LAEYENQVREARGWFLDRREELLSREGQIAQTEAELAARQAEVAPAAAELARRESELAAAEQELTARREAIEQQAIAASQELEAQRAEAWQPIREALAQLEQRREAVEARVGEIEAAEFDLARRAAGPLPEELARNAELDAREDGLTVREQQLDQRELQLTEAERLLNHGQTQLAKLRSQLEAEREQVVDRARHDRRRLAEGQRLKEAELAERRQALERASEQLDHRRAALTQSQAEVSELHREALELRLATEELWSELAVAVPPGALASALAATRARLADHYKLERSEIARQKAELEDLSTELAAQHEHLKGQTGELQDWLSGRQAALERQAAALVAREKELDQ
jgi:hypothetical protein